MCTKTTAVQTGSFYLPFFLFQPPHGKVLCCTMFFFSFAFLLFLCVFFFPKSKKCRLNRWRLHQKLAFEPMSFALFFFSEAASYLAIKSFQRPKSKKVAALQCGASDTLDTNDIVSWKTCRLCTTMSFVQRWIVKVHLQME